MPYETTPAETNLTPSIDGTLAFWQQRLNRLEAEVGATAGSGQYPVWWTEEDTTPLREIVPQLKEEGADLSNVSRYYDLFSKEAKLRSVVMGQEPSSQPLQQLTYNLSEELVARAFKAEATDGSLHTAMLEDLGTQTDIKSGVLTPELNLLKQAYGYRTLTELLGIGGDEYSDKLRDILRQPNPIRWMRHNEEERSVDFKWADTQHAMRTWMGKAVEATTGIPTDEALDYVFSASRRGDSEQKDILSIIEKFDHFGVERVRKLTAFSGIHGLEAYSTEQLERMETLASSPDRAAERLVQHDVTAVLVNRFGDHNGVMHDVAVDFDDDIGRTLFFEVTTMDDIYRRIVTLRKSGVKPSTLVLAAHSAPGQFMVSDDRERGSKRRDIATVASRKLVQMVVDTNGLDVGERSFSIHGIKGMAKLVEDYMQPSRAIDDDEADMGRKKIIFEACHAATEAKVGDIDDSGEKTQIGLESVISQLGADLISSGFKTSVDIYGAPGGIQMHRSERGVHYSGQPASFDDALSGRPHMHAERVRVEGGNLTKQEVYDIVLRKA
jgi:hypothetical protein